MAQNTESPIETKRVLFEIALAVIQKGKTKPKPDIIREFLPRLEAAKEADKLGGHLDPEKEAVVNQLIGSLNQIVSGSEDLTSLYQSFRSDEWLVGSFQNAYKRNNSRGSEREIKNRIEKRIAELFDIQIEWEPPHSVHHPGKVFVALERLENERGRLLSYGECCSEARSMRGSNHYFYLISDYAKLKKAFNSFIAQPGFLKDFVKLAFGWRNTFLDHESFNRRTMHENDREVDLFQDMRYLHLLDTEDGTRQDIEVESPPNEPAPEPTPKETPATPPPKSGNEGLWSQFSDLARKAEEELARRNRKGRFPIE